MEKTWGISLEDRKMLYAPWAMDEAGSYRAPREAEARRHYTVSGAAVRETLLYFEELGGDTTALIGLLNDHVPDPKFRTSRELLLDGSRWYTNEYYFYFIMFTKRIIGRYDFRYGEDDPEGRRGPMSEHHKIYELGFMTKVPWGCDPEGKEAHDLALNNNIVLTQYLEENRPGAFAEFIDFQNLVLPDGFNVTQETYKNEALWCGFQFIAYGYEFFKILVNDDDAIATAAFEACNRRLRIVRLARAASSSQVSSLLRQMIQLTNDTLDFTAKLHHAGWLEIDMKLKAKVDRSHVWPYERATFPSSGLLWLGSISSIMAQHFGAPVRPEERMRIYFGSEGPSFILDYLWTPRPKLLTPKNWGIAAATILIIITSLRIGFFAPGLGSINLLYPVASGLAILGISIYLLKQRRNINHTAEAAYEQLRELENTTHELMKERALLETKVKERTQELHEANERLREQDKAKTDFFTNISHELRTPITLIRSPLEHILSGKAGKELNHDHPDFHMMLKSTLRLGRLVDDLLTRVKIGIDGLRPELVPIEVVGTVKNYVAEFESAAAMKGIKLAFENRGATKIGAAVDKRGFETIVLNLLSNALKFTGQGGTVTVSIGASADRERYWISVRDTGSGIPKDQQDKLFVRFGAIYEKGREEYRGMGIGLSLAKDYAALHGGDITVESEEGKGAMFTVTLPNHKEAMEGPAEEMGATSITRERLLVETHRETLQENRVESTASFSGKERQRILIVDDNPDVVGHLAEIFGAAYEIEKAYDGEEAFHRLRTQAAPDLILSDVMMPKMDGVELLRKTKELRHLQGVPFVFLTARATEEERLKEIEEGAADYICKPYSERELRGKVRTLLEIREKTLLEVERIFNQSMRSIRRRDEALRRTELRDAFDRYEFTAREREVATILVKEGLGNKDIAAALGMTESTAAKHIASMMKKTGTKSRAEFIAIIRRESE